MCNITSDFFLALMHVTARRIARLDRIDSEAARADYEQAVSAMTADEIDMFASAVVKAAIEIG